jgi:3-deoxy-manno-octulosonate cytidylyltransferase (CMP-KDO synthetase)
VEHHGNNHQKNVIAIIPARYASTRLPGKMLLPVAGKPLILHTVDRANEASSVSHVIVATDDQRIFDAVTGSGNEAVMTSAEHQSGSDRIAEVARTLPENSIVVNVQGDEPVISPATIDAAVNALIGDPSANMSTTYERIGSVEDLFNPNIVKIVVGENGNAVYFSRSPVPYPRDAAQRHGGDLVSALRKEPELLAGFHKHTGLYVYRREYLLEFTKLEQTGLEKLEMLEQLRALENGVSIVAVEFFSRSIGVETADDLKFVRAILEDEEMIHELGA